MGGSVPVRQRLAAGAHREEAVRRTDVDHDEISEVLGEESGYCDGARFVEKASTDGRMVHEDNETIMFANREDSGEYIDFHLIAE